MEYETVGLRSKASEHHVSSMPQSDELSLSQLSESRDIQFRIAGGNRIDPSTLVFCADVNVSGAHALQPTTAAHGMFSKMKLEV